jgi:glycerophosphoryl diester phosphodiesterase
MRKSSSRSLGLVFASVAAIAWHNHTLADQAGQLARAHAHNDYEHEQPLTGALAQGFTSVEADIWLVDGQLLVAHDRDQVQPGRTLTALYLEPLRTLARSHEGHIYPGFDHSVQLLIDIKSEGAETYRALHEVLERYADILSTFSYRNVREKAVTVVVSGHRPLELMARQPLRFAAYDGRWSDAGTEADAAFMPLISDNWNNCFKWIGVGQMPEDERQKLHDFVAAVHEKGQRVRFWATPEDKATREAVWRELVAAGADYINTDDLASLHAFLRENDSHPADPEIDWFGDVGELVAR